MFAAYRIVVERIVLFVKIVNQYFERKEFFVVAPVPMFWWRFPENQGRECQLFIQSVLQATQASIYLTWYDDGY